MDDPASRWVNCRTQGRAWWCAHSRHSLQASWLEERAWMGERETWNERGREYRTTDTRKEWGREGCWVPQRDGGLFAWGEWQQTSEPRDSAVSPRPMAAPTSTPQKHRPLLLPHRADSSVSFLWGSFQNEELPWSKLLWDLGQVSPLSEPLFPPL